MLMAGRMHPPFLFCRAKRETGRARSKEKSVGALRCSGPPRDGGRRIGASADLARPSGTLYSSATVSYTHLDGYKRQLCIPPNGLRQKPVGHAGLLPQARVLPQNLLRIRGSLVRRHGIAVQQKQQFTRCSASRAATQGKLSKYSIKLFLCSSANEKPLLSRKGVPSPSDARLYAISGRIL